MNKKIEEIIRVNQAGEYGAQKIYRGQLAVLKNFPIAKEINKMLLEEEKHLNKFNDLIASRKVRPTALSPLWHVGGYALGVFTAILGPKSTMACTEAVEEVICKHYDDQSLYLKKNDKELYKIVKAFSEDEKKHMNKAISYGTGDSIRHKILKKTIKAITKTAIKISKKI